MQSRGEPQAAYLQPGDVVRTEASYLGSLEKTVVPRSDTGASAADGG